MTLFYIFAKHFNKVQWRQLDSHSCSCIQSVALISIVWPLEHSTEHKWKNKNKNHKRDVFTLTMKIFPERSGPHSKTTTLGPEIWFLPRNSECESLSKSVYITTINLASKQQLIWEVKIKLHVLRLLRSFCATAILGWPWRSNATAAFLELQLFLWPSSEGSGFPNVFLGLWWAHLEWQNPFVHCFSSRVFNEKKWIQNFFHILTHSFIAYIFFF